MRHGVIHMTDRQSENWYPRLLSAITAAQAQLVGTVDSSELFDELLNVLLELCESEYGFIGETHLDENGQVFLRTHSITNIAWNEYTRRYYDENASGGLEFRNLETLFGRVMTEERAVIANAPATDPRRGGLPLGHPALDSFLGIPLHSAGRMIGMAGVANRPGGYDEALLERLAPFLQTCANAIFALRADAERTQALEELSLEQQRLQAILDVAYEAIISIDENGNIESMNKQVEHMFGYPESQLLGENVSALMPAPYKKVHSDYIQHYCQTGDAKVNGEGRETLGLHRNGSGFPIHLTIIETAVRGSRLFIGMIRDLSEQQETDRRLKQLQSELDRGRFGQLIGRSPGMNKLYSTIHDVAQGDWTVLIEGETGTGKELVARAIHSASTRSQGPFIAVNCAALSDSLLESQLFGHRKGAFSGAIKDQQGYFQAADGGTLFLDEIGDISEGVQTSLLRALEYSEIIPLGDTRPRRVDVRIVTATNRTLSVLAESGKFREDLFYRLRVGRVNVPPLRARREDIAILAEAFLAEMRVATGKAISGISRTAIRKLEQYSWPGNVRELKNAIQHAVIHCRSSAIELNDLPSELLTATTDEWVHAAPGAESRNRIRVALEQSRGNKKEAARILGVSRATLYRRLKELDNEGS